MNGVKEDENGGSIYEDNNMTFRLHNVKPKYTKWGVGITGAMILTIVFFILRLVYASGVKSKALEDVVVMTAEHEESIATIKTDIASMDHEYDSRLVRIEGKLDVMLDGMKLTYEPIDDTP